jgi:hypothetical protein
MVAGASVTSGFVLLDEEIGDAVPARWAGGLLGLGARLARRSQRDGSQLVVAVSLPVRDYAAHLVSAGWILTQPPVPPTDALAEADAIAPRTPVRMTTEQWLIADRFMGVDRTHGTPRIHVGGTSWLINHVEFITADPTLSESRYGRHSVARPGSLVRTTGRQKTWSIDQCVATPTVAIIGTRSRLEPELALQTGWAGGGAGADRFDLLHDILRPDDGRSAFSASVILPGGRECLPDLPPQTRLAVLDGASSIRWLAEVRTPLVVALIDRSSTDESAAMAVLQRRSIGQPVQLDSLRWQPLPGMEALAFEVRV